MRCAKALLFSFVLSLALGAMGGGAQNLGVQVQGAQPPEARTEDRQTTTPKPARKSFYETLVDNPTGLMTAVAALVAAFIALVSLVINRSLTIRNQKDTQFYEALKRFGDNESPILRSSAAGLLAQMGRQRSLIIRRRLYFTTAADQLIIGILLEKDSVVLMSIADALDSLSSLGRQWMAERLWNANHKLKYEFEEKLVEWALRKNISGLEGFSEPVIAELDAISPQASSTVRDWLTELKEATESSKKARISEEFSIRFRSVRAQSDALDHPNSRSINRDLVQLFRRQATANRLFVRVLARGPAGRLTRRLRKLTGLSRLGRVAVWVSWLADVDLSYRALMNLDLYGSTLRRANLSNTEMINVNFTTCDLRGAKLSNATLYRIVFERADLRGADFSNSELRRVKLGEAKIDVNTNFTKCNWWSANFYEWEYGLFSRWNPVNHETLEVIFSRYGSDLDRIRNRSEIHASVRSFLKERQLSPFQASPGSQ